MIDLLSGFFSVLPVLLPPAIEPPRNLSDTLEKLALEAESYDAQCGIAVKSLTREEYVFRRKAEQFFAPASNTKLVTTAAALGILGSGYFFETRFLSSGVVRDGTLTGDLWVRGGGDPCFSGRFFNGNATAPFDALAESLKKQGIRKIEGSIVLDDRCFDRQFLAPQWPQNQLSLDYCAPVCGLPLNEGCLGIEVLPGAPGKKPSYRLIPTVPFAVLNEMETETGRGDPKLDFAFTGEASLRLGGSVHAQSGSYNGRVAVRSPLDFFGSSLCQSLQRDGVELSGSFRLVAEKENLPQGASLLYTQRSPILNAVYLANKDSMNFFAEHLMKTIGSETEKEGSWRGGIRAVQSFLQKKGISCAGIQLEDGSGLSRGNRLSPECFVNLLSWVYQSEFRDAFLKTLPVSGTEGTLEKRLNTEPYKGRVLAKTGWIQGASALSGYVTAKNNEVYAFSVLINYNGKTNNKVFKAITDSVCRALVDAGQP